MARRSCDKPLDSMKPVQALIRRSSEVLGSVLKHAPGGDCAVAVVTPERSKPNSNVPRTANPLPGILDKTFIPTSYHRSMAIDGALVGATNVALVSLGERSELREAAP